MTGTLILLVLFVGVPLYLARDWLAMTAAFLADPEKRELRKFELKLEFLKWLARQVGSTEREVRKRNGP